MQEGLSVILYPLEKDFLAMGEQKISKDAVKLWYIQLN